MPELLSPAGDMECLKAAILAGCDAVYLGGKLFGARAFSNNFSNEELIEAINYAHLYGVKVYVTINTLIYEREINSFMEYVDFLYRNNVDALIIQDIGMASLIRKTYPNLELHASTQMHIHNIEGVKLVEKLGLKRAVLARETNIDTIKYIKENTNIELEIFIHGALCVSYSGQCLMSSLIGNRSGNRGTCSGSCRQKYNLIENNKKLNKEEYLLSTKDLNSLENIGQLIEIGVDSLKIEGRMKSKEYVYMVTKLYRKAIDSYIKNKKIDIDSKALKALKTIFNRRYTKGFLFNADNNDITNSYRPNHLGIEIGKVIGSDSNFVKILLTDELNINDGIRFVDNDYGLIVTSMFKNKARIKTAKKGDIITIPIKEKIKNTLVLKTTDYNLNKKIDKIISENNKKINIKGKIIAKSNKNLTLQISDGKNEVIEVGNKVLKAINRPMTKDDVNKRLNKLGNTIYKFENLNIEMDDNVFIPIKELNDIKNNAISKLNEKRLYKYEYIKQEYSIDLKNYKKEKNYNIYLSTLKQYEKIKNLPFTHIYVEKELIDLINDDRKVLKLERVMNEYDELDKLLLVGELGSVNKYKNVMTDWSLNVTNSYSVALLHSLGVKQITLSYELTFNQIKQIIEGYKTRYNKHPNLEVIVYGKEEAMISKFNLNKLYNANNSYLEDRFKNRYKIVVKNDLMKIYNYKPRKIENIEEYFKIGINNIRYNLLDEENIDFCIK